MNLSPLELQKLRDVSIYRILGIQYSGRRISIRCPLPNHRDATPSFCLYPNNSYFCFGCGTHGRGAIDFCRDLEFNFIETIEELVKYI